MGFGAALSALKGSKLLKGAGARLSSAGSAVGGAARSGGSAARSAASGLPGRLQRHAKAGGFKDNAIDLLTGVGPEAWKELPGKRAGFLGGLAAFGTGKMVYDMATEPGEQWDDDLKYGVEGRRASQLREASFRRQRQNAMESLSRLASVDPHLYNEVLSGRKLPQGAMVFGGQPRVDLLEQLGMQMAQGHFVKETDPQQDLNRILGVQ